MARKNPSESYQLVGLRSWGYDLDLDYNDYGDDLGEGINIISSHSDSLHFHFPAMGAMIKTSQKSSPE